MANLLMNKAVPRIECPKCRGTGWCELTPLLGPPAVTGRCDLCGGSGYLNPSDVFKEVRLFAADKSAELNRLIADYGQLFNHRLHRLCNDGLCLFADIERYADQKARNYKL